MKGSERRLPALAALMVTGAAVAVFDLLTGWTIAGGVFAIVVVVALFLGALAAMCAAAIIAFRDRSRIKTLVEDSPTKAARVAGRARWSSLLAVGFAILVFANCSGGIGNPQTSAGAMSDPSRYWAMAAALLLPTVVLLALPGVLATLAERTIARPWALAAIYAAGAAAIVAFISAPLALFFGVSACDFGTSTGTCAAGVGGVANGFTIAALALFLPYLTLLPAFLPRNKPPS